MYYVYIMANAHGNVLYTGVTSDLVRRTYEHKNKMIDGFTKKYNVTRLVYYESCESVESAISREKSVKGLLRSKKRELIASQNPFWDDLCDKL